MKRTNLDLPKVKSIIQNSLFLKLPGAQRILNLGAADGNFYEKYPWKNYELYNLDNNSENKVFENECIKKYVPEKYPNIKNIIGDCTDMNMFSDDFFDMIIFTHLIEHLTSEQIEKTLNEIQRVCKKNGIVVISTPNYKVRKFFGMHKANEYHIKEFTYKELYDIVKQKLKIMRSYGALHVNTETSTMTSTKIDDPENSYVMWMVCRNEK